MGENEVALISVAICALGLKLQFCFIRATKKPTEIQPSFADARLREALCNRARCWLRRAHASCPRRRDRLPYFTVIIRKDAKRGNLISGVIRLDLHPGRRARANSSSA